MPILSSDRNLIFGHFKTKLRMACACIICVFVFSFSDQCSTLHGSTHRDIISPFFSISQQLAPKSSAMFIADDTKICFWLFPAYVVLLFNPEASLMWVTAAGTVFLWNCRLNSTALLFVGLLFPFLVTLKTKIVKSASESMSGALDLIEIDGYTFPLYLAVL